MLPPPPLKPDSASQANFQALSTQLGDSCSAPILEPERSALIQEALADSHLQAVKAQLERRGLGMNAEEAQAVQLVGGVQLLIPFGQDAHLVWTRTNGQTAAVGLIRQGNKTLNVGGDGQERVVRFLSAQQAEKLLRKLREKGKFQEFEGKLAQKGKRVGKVRVLFDETNKIAMLGIAAEGSEKISHQVRIKVKANKDDEPEDDAEPAIQATACGQASGEAVPLGARLQPLALDPGEGGDVTTGSYDIPEGRDYGTNICVSQWGYAYDCRKLTPIVSLSTTNLTLPPTFINQQVQASFVIWNGGGGRLTGTVSVPAPFSIVSGGSFSLLPGQPQEVVVRFSSGTAGSFSKSIAISSNGGNATVTATGVAHKVSFSPAPLDFGSGLLVMREQCNQMGDCGLRTEKVGLPIEKQLTVKNEGTVSVSLTLSTAAPYKIVSVLPTLSPGQSAQVTLRFDPNESGSFSGSVQVGISEGQGSITSPPLVGVAHKIEIDPAELNFGLVFVGGTRERKLTVKNQGVTTVTLEVPHTTQNTASPFRVMLESSLALAPGESKGVPVQFSATTSGQFTGTVRLMSGQAVLEIPAKAQAYTEEEYREILKQSILATCQATEGSQGARNIQFVPGLDQDFLFYRMPCPTEEELENLLQMILNGQDLAIDNIVLEGFDPEQVINALHQILNGPYQEYLQRYEEILQTVSDRSLQAALIGQAFAALMERISQLASQNRDLAQFLNALEYVDGQELGAWLITMANWLVTAYAAMDPMIGTTIKALWGLWAALSSYLSHFGPNPPGSSVSYGLVSILVGVMHAYPAGGSAVAAVLRNGSGFDQIYGMKAILSIATFSGMPPFQNSGLTPEFVPLFLNRIEQAFSDPAFQTGPLHAYLSRYIATLGFYGDSASMLNNVRGNPVMVENYSNNVGGFIAFVALGAFVDENGRRWSINAVPAVGLHDGFGLTTPGLNAGVHLIASKTVLVDNIERRVTVFIHVEAKLGVSEAEKIAHTIQKITEEAVRWIKFKEANTPGLGLGTAVTVLIAFNVEPGAVDQVVTTLENMNLQTPVLILYLEGGEWKARCVGDCSDKHFLDAVAAALAQALGRPYSGGSENSLGEMLSILDQAMAAAEYFYGYGNPTMAFYLAFGICGRDLGCILFLAEALIQQAQEECGNQPCPRPMSFPRLLLTERLDRRGGR